MINEMLKVNNKDYYCNLSFTFISNGGLFTLLKQLTYDIMTTLYIGAIKYVVLKIANK